MNDDELINYDHKFGNYFNYGLLIPELKDIVKRFQIMIFKSPDDAYLNTEGLRKEYEEINKEHCFIYCFHEFGIYDDN